MPRAKPKQKVLTNLNLADLRRASRDRCRRWHGRKGVNHWTPERWYTAASGEMGEASNALKKLWRIEDRIMNKSKPGRQIRTRAQAIKIIGKELADTIVYLDLMAESLGIDLAHCIRLVFNAKSKECGFPERI